MRTLHFYMDDSGTRHPDLKDRGNGNQPNWFGLGGVIIDEADEERLKETIQEFKNKWKITTPLHSCNIRQRNGAFSWLKDNPQNTKKFLDELTALLISAPVIGHGCVIDRPSYNRRYQDRYGNDKWSLCNTAFTIAVERAAKYALSQGARLRVFVESSSRPDERKLQAYYENLRGIGNPFNPTRSSGYKPLAQQEFGQALFEFKVKQKSSPIMQIADLYLYPICKAGYDPANLAYRCLYDNKKLIDQLVDPKDLATLGIKYSCFDSSPALLKRYA